MTLNEVGKAVCITAPMGTNGLEGYAVKDVYKVQFCEGLKGKYYRVWPDSESEYYETCGPTTFSRFFQVVP